MQEDALVALDNQKEIHAASESGGYGRETDWWSLGATIYELVYGVAPFFAKDIRRTYDLIVNHEVHAILSLLLTVLIQVENSAVPRCNHFDRLRFIHCRVRIAKQQHACLISYTQAPKITCSTLGTEACRSNQDPFVCCRGFVVTASLRFVISTENLPFFLMR